MKKINLILKIYRSSFDNFVQINKLKFYWDFSYFKTQRGVRNGYCGTGLILVYREPGSNFGTIQTLLEVALVSLFDFTYLGFLLH